MRRQVCSSWRRVTLLALAFLLMFTVASEAGVTLTPRFDGKVIADGAEDYVYFGKYDHRLVKYNGSKESSPTPILWRVMELETSEDKSGAILLSHYLLESMAYQGTYGGSNPFYYRPNTTINANTWDGSEVQTWLNSVGNDVSVTPGTGNGNSSAFKGFLHEDYFSSAESGSMLNYPYNRHLEGESADLSHKVVLPSGKMSLNHPYSCEIGTWFGSELTYENFNTRKAHFKGDPSSFTAGNADDWSYWMRSPHSATNMAFAVNRSGQMSTPAVPDFSHGVRPAFFLDLESVIFKSKSSDVFAYSSTDDGGSFSNPFILFLSGDKKPGLPEFASADIALASAEMDGRTLTLTFGKDISPAVRSWPDIGDFTLKHGSATMQPVSVASADSDKLVLTFADAVVAGETLSLDYNLNYDAVSFDFSTPPAAVAIVMASSPDIEVKNLTPSTATTPGDITVTVDGTVYRATRQTDGTYLILLPVDTDSSVLNGLAVTVALPDGASISPGSDQNVDFSSGSVTFTITAQDRTTTEDIEIEVRIGPVAGVVVTTDETRFDVYVTYNADGTLSVEVHLPFAEGFAPDTLSAISAVFDPLTNITFTFVDEDDNVVPLGTARRAGNAYLRINATAESVATMNSAELSSISYSLTGDTMGYQQDFNPALKLSAMQLTYTNDPPSTDPDTEESSSSSGVGCSAGLGALGALGLFALIAPLAAARRRRR